VNVLLIGPPGSGKGTQAERIASHYGLAYLGLGEMLRASAAAGRLGGLEELLAEGELVPDETAIGVIGERLAEADTKSGFVLDGFPRNLPQAKALDSLLDELARPLSVVLVLRVPDDECGERLLQRGRESGRADDVHDVIVRRLELYHEETEPVVAYYESEGRRVVTIHGERAPEEVWGEIRQALDGVATQISS
jgi:adenylate kinase